MMTKYFTCLVFCGGLTMAQATTSHAPRGASAYQPSAPGPASNSAPSTEKDVRKRIQDHLNAITTLTADFSQSSSNGTHSSGRFYLQRSKTGFGKMRLEYNPPVKLLLVSNGDLLMQHDLETDQVSSFSIDSTPAALLLQPHLDFAKEAIVRDTKVDGNSATLTLARAKGDDGSSLTITFFLTPTILLKEWTVLDNQGNRTHVTFNNVRLGAQLPEKLFVVNR